MNLSPGAYRLLNRIKEELRRTPQTERKRSGKAVQEIEAWCAEYDIALDSHRLPSNILLFEQSLLDHIDDVLKSLGHPPLGAELGRQTTTAQARQGSLEAKSVRENPRAHRVLVNLPARPAPEWLSAEPREVLDLDWRHIELDAFDALIQVENLDSFYDFAPDAEALAPFNSPLVVYRGDAHYGGGFSRLAGAWASRCAPHLYAGDFDAAGIAFALSSQATHVLLPPLAWLAQRVTPDHLPAEQITHQPALRRHIARLPGGHPLRNYLAILLQQQRGLRQQWFDERLVMVALG
ncbi:MAG TPA: hypothetical protein VK991_04255 [Halomonas sp.]|nr:hypothetical protein [Halomonas sp.]